LGLSHGRARPAAGPAAEHQSMHPIRSGAPRRHRRPFSQPCGISLPTLTFLNPSRSPTITVPPYDPLPEAAMSASSTRQRKTGGLSTTDSDGVDHSTAAPQGKAIKQTPVSKCASAPVVFPTVPQVRLSDPS